ncbi:MAG: TusE/DsrC/DsvC family sulfur relay protein [Gammaproteobacteria bacterium]|nr:TusE/DsrC/DsvC family sulfur relay protein [Gammaproteobacteria bacterium]MCP5416771.1 TusE/DsrC/DsvC family sulfur relay protein [Chromatiaceae bacterium]
MSYEVTSNGYLVNMEDWNEDVARELAEKEGIVLTQKAWDIINYLRDEYFNNNGNQPNERNMVKHFKDIWTDEEKVDAKSLYAHFPMGPAKQAGKIAGLPETKRKGGY